MLIILLSNKKYFFWFYAHCSLRLLAGLILPALSPSGERAVLYLFVKNLFFHIGICFLLNKNLL